MPEFRPIATVHDLDLQDEFASAAGWNAAAAGLPAPGSTRSRGYHHGYRMCLIEMGKAQPCAATEQLFDELEYHRPTWH